MTVRNPPPCGSGCGRRVARRLDGNERTAGRRACRSGPGVALRREGLPRELISVEAVGIDWQGLEALVAADASCPARAEVLEILRETPRVDLRRPGPRWSTAARSSSWSCRAAYLINIWPRALPRPCAVSSSPRKGGTPRLRERLTAAGETAAGVEEAGVEEAGMEETGFAEAGAAVQTDAVAEAAELPARAQDGPQAGTPAMETPAAGISAVEAPAVGAPAATQPEPTDADKAAAREPCTGWPSRPTCSTMPSSCPRSRWSTGSTTAGRWPSRAMWRGGSATGPTNTTRSPRSCRGPLLVPYPGALARALCRRIRRRELVRPRKRRAGLQGRVLDRRHQLRIHVPDRPLVVARGGARRGFLRTRYEEYLPLDGHYVYQQTSRTNWLGPVKVKFALVCRLWDINRKGGRQ